MIDLKEFLLPEIKTIVKDLVASKSGMRKLKIRRFIDPQRIEFINFHPILCQAVSKILRNTNLDSFARARIQLKSDSDMNL